MFTQTANPLLDLVDRVSGFLKSSSVGAVSPKAVGSVVTKICMNEEIAIGERGAVEAREFLFAIRAVAPEVAAKIDAITEFVQKHQEESPTYDPGTYYEWAPATFFLTPEDRDFLDLVSFAAREVYAPGQYLGELREALSFRREIPLRLDSGTMPRFDFGDGGFDI